MVERIRPAETGDLNRLVEIYNHYITETHVTFDTIPFAVGERTQWFTQFSESGPLRLLVTEIDGVIGALVAESVRAALFERLAVQVRSLGPVCSPEFPLPDADEDRTPDCNDGCPTDPNKTDPGICGCGTGDTDGHGVGTEHRDEGCPDDASKDVLLQVAREEKTHLDWLLHAFTEQLSEP